MLVRMIAPDWLKAYEPSLKKVVEGDVSKDSINSHNDVGYNIYWFPNHPKQYTSGNVDGKDIDTFEWVFIDMDLKDGKHTKDSIITLIMANEAMLPTRVVDSGGGIHAYWKISDLDVMSYLRFQKRLANHFDTDPEVSKICQLMRLWGTNNTKLEGNPRACEELFYDNVSYTCEELDKLLPPITAADEQYCKDHYARTFQTAEDVTISGELPVKFGQLVKKNKEAAELFAGVGDDRSKNDYRLGHLMLANGFSKEEALNVLYNSAKGMQRAPTHRYNYAKNIVDKIWAFEQAENKASVDLAPSVRDILARGEDVIIGERFPCHKFIDDTKHGFRLGQVVGIVAGSGVGKTTLTLNAFLWFAENNPDYHHMFFSLEQPAGEIASRIRTICGDNQALYDKIHIISNDNLDGIFRNLSLTDIETQVRQYQEETGNKVGTVVIDHIGVLDSNVRNGENDGLIGICKRMKPVARTLNVMLIMLSQAPREKAGIGDLELDKNAAYGTVFFESFVDYLVLLWQPLKRCYASGAPTIMAFKFGKIRHKKQGQDKILEDVCYQLYFDPETERLRELTQDEETSARYHASQAANARKADKKTDVVPYVSRRLDGSLPATKASDNRPTSKHH